MLGQCLYDVLLAYTLTVTIIGMPVAFWMFEKAPTVLTLRK